MIEEEEEIPETDFKQTNDAIYDAYSQVGENQNSISEKESIVKQMKKEYSDRKAQVSNSEQNFSMIDYQLQNEMDEFNVSKSFHMNYLDQTKSEFEDQLKKLEDEKALLLSKAESLSDKCNSMFSSIQKASEEFKSMTYQFPLKSEIKKVSRKETEQLLIDIKKMMDEIEKITDQIIETKSTIIYLDSNVAQVHTLFLCEIEHSNKIKNQIYNQLSENFNSYDLQKEDYDKNSFDQRFHNSNQINLKKMIEILNQNKEKIQIKENEKESEINEVRDKIESKKDQIFKLREQIQHLNDELFELQRKKMKNQDQILKSIQEKRDQISQVQKEKEQIKYYIRKEKRKVNAGDIHFQHINELNLDFQKEDDQIEFENNELDDLENKLKIKEKKHSDLDNKLKHDKNVLNQAYSELRHQIIEQEKIETELKYHELEPIPVFEPSDLCKDLQKKVHLIHQQIEKMKREIKILTNKKKNYSKEKIQLLKNLNEQTKTSLNLEEEYKKEKDTYYVFCKKHHRALVCDQNLTENINNLHKSNKKKLKLNRQKKKDLLNIISECGVKNVNGNYIVDKEEEKLGPNKREKILHHFIEKYKEIINKINEMKQIIGFNLSEKVRNAILNDWDEFIDKQITTI